ncbi:MAG TPA: glycosyltransferase [Dehalococcoidia bacterium]|nr:glycosyltransferase [Dehalococcoidia bacterium]
MTRILITTINYAPEATGIAPYATGLAEHLVAQGYRVTTLTGLPHYPAWRVSEGYRGRLAFTEHRAGVDVRRRWHYVPRTQSALRRGLYEATFLASGLSALALPQPDAVLGIVPALSDGVLARVAAARFRVPYGLLFQDLVGQSAGQSGITGGAAVSGVTRLAEGWAARGAAAVGVVAEGFRPYLEGVGVEPGRIRRVRNWTHTGAATIDRDAMRAWLDLPSDAVVCLHAGNMGHKQGLENLVECARLAAASAPAMLFVLAGDGSQRAAIEALAGRYELTNVRFLPLQSDQIFPSVLACADILLVNQRGTVSDMALPSKLTSYFAAGRPVVAAVARSSETWRELTWSGGGLAVLPDDPPALLDALLRVAADPGLAAHLAASARRWSDEMLSPDAALRSYEQLIAAVLASGRHGRVHSRGRSRTRVQPITNSDEAARDRWAA